MHYILEFAVKEEVSLEFEHKYFPVHFDFVPNLG
jgi:hypothetical protein